jgi:hypothetical protein
MNINPIDPIAIEAYEYIISRYLLGGNGKSTPKNTV